jgi:hypothetical protein
LSLSVAGERLAALIREQLQDLEDFRNEQNGAAKAFTISAGRPRHSPSARVAAHWNGW